MRPLLLYISESLTIQTKSSVPEEKGKKMQTNKWSLTVNLCNIIDHVHLSGFQFLGTCMEICMQVQYGQPPKIQETVGALTLAKFLSVVHMTHLFNATLFHKVLSQLWVTFTHLGRTTPRIYSF